MTALIRQISMMCLLMAIAEQLLKEKTSFACLRMIAAGRIAVAVFTCIGSILNRCAR